MHGCLVRAVPHADPAVILFVAWGANAREHGARVAAVRHRIRHRAYEVDVPDGRFGVHAKRHATGFEHAAVGIEPELDEVVVAVELGCLEVRVIHVGDYLIVDATVIDEVGHETSVLVVLFGGLHVLSLLHHAMRSSVL